MQDLFGLVVQAPCPVDYQDSSSADGSAPAAATASGAPVSAAAANGPASAAAANGDEGKAQQGRAEAAEDGQAWRRQPVAAQTPSPRANGQVSSVARCLDRRDTSFWFVHTVQQCWEAQHLQVYTHRSHVPPNIKLAPPASTG